MADSVPLAEWYVEAVVADRSLGNTTLTLALNLLAFGLLLPPLSSPDISVRAVGAKQPGACGSRVQRSPSSGFSRSPWAAHAARNGG